MTNKKEEFLAIFGGKLRTRVCGVCTEGNKILLVKHISMKKTENALENSSENDEISFFYAPPGGGMEFGENAVDCLKREFLEETGLEITVGKMLFVNEYLALPLHAIEIYFDVKITGGKLATGYDPELSKDNQLIQEVLFLDYDELQKMPKTALHAMFHQQKTLKELQNITGYCQF